MSYQLIHDVSEKNLSSKIGFLNCQWKEEQTKTKYGHCSIQIFVKHTKLMQFQINVETHHYNLNHPEIQVKND